jgi:hypothetical protein
VKKLREIHLYLGCLFAPVLIFFAVTELFSLHRGRKDHSYIPPKAVVLASEVHQFQHIGGAGSETATPLRYFILAAAIGLVVTTCLGILMAFRYSQSRSWAAVCLAAGLIIPVTILLIYH